MEKTPENDVKLAAVCGLWCPGCTIYVAAHETAEERARIAALLGRPAESLVCEGCRAEIRYVYCETCKLFACATQRGLDFCGSCPEYPCQDLREFQGARPHRLELWQAQARIREVGWEQWFAEMAVHYACPECGTVNGAYLLACRRCGATPSCAYVALHQEEIVAHLSERAG